MVLAVVTNNGCTINHKILIIRQLQLASKHKKWNKCPELDSSCVKLDRKKVSRNLRLNFRRENVSFVAT